MSLVDAAAGLVCFVRGDRGDRRVLAVCNFTPVPRYDVMVGVPFAGSWVEILNSDSELYGGSGIGNLGGVNTTTAPDGSHSISVTAAPLACIVLRHDVKR